MQTPQGETKWEADIHGSFQVNRGSFLLFWVFFAIAIMRGCKMDHHGFRAPLCMYLIDS
jgi:hypothetical protein